MEALLGFPSDAPRGLSHACTSIDDLQRQLHHIVSAKSSDTRAEHVSLSFEFRYNTTFHLAAESEDGVADGADPANQPDGQQPVTRTVSASETVQNQPSDDPVLQRAVAKHIVSTTGRVDGSSWNVRQVSRNSQGWTFTYLCKHSMQSWKRQHAKNTQRPVVAAFSGNGGLDPINLCKAAPGNIFVPLLTDLVS